MYTTGMLVYGYYLSNDPDELKHPYTVGYTPHDEDAMFDDSENEKNIVSVYSGNSDEEIRYIGEVLLNFNAIFTLPQATLSLLPTPAQIANVSTYVTNLLNNPDFSRTFKKNLKNAKAEIFILWGTS